MFIFSIVCVDVNFVLKFLVFRYIVLVFILF